MARDKPFRNQIPSSGTATPAPHTHAESDVTSLIADLAGKYGVGGTDVAITDGGTGASSLPTGILKGAGTGAITAAAAGTDYLSPAAIGVTVQPLDTDLTTIAGLTATTDNVIQSVAGSWASRTMAQLKTALALVKADVGLGSVDNTADAAKAVLSASKWTTARTVAITGDLAYTSPSLDGTGNVTAAGTLATVNSNVGAFGSASSVATFTVNAKGLTTAAAATPIAIAGSQVTSGQVAPAQLGTGTPSAATFLKGDGTWAIGGAGIPPGIVYFFDTSTTMANPGSDTMRWNSTDCAVTPVTQIAVSATGPLGTNIAAYLAACAGGGITFSDLGGKQYVFNVSTVVNNTTWMLLNVTQVFVDFNPSTGFAEFITTNRAGPGAGDVVGPASATSGNLPSYNGTTGKIIQDSGVAAANVVTLAGSQTLTSKTLTSPVINTPTGDVGTGTFRDSVDTRVLAVSRVKAAVNTNLTLSGAQTIDGVSCVAGDIVGAFGQTTAADCGPYVVAAGAWARVNWADTAGEVASLTTVQVQSGTANGGTRWVTSFKSTDTLGTTAMKWAQVPDNDTQWTAVSYAANWADVGGGNLPLRYRKIGASEAKLQGYIIRNTTASGAASSICTALPAGFRPTATIVVGMLMNAGGTYSLNQITLANTGALVASSNVPIGTAVWIDAKYFTD